jgi:hypothetical protein
MDMIMRTNGLGFAGNDQETVIMGIFALLRCLNQTLYLMNVKLYRRLISMASILLFSRFISFHTADGRFIQIIAILGCGTACVRFYIAFEKRIFGYRVFDIVTLVVHANTLL